MSTDFTTLTDLNCPLLEQPTNDMCMGDLIKLLAFNTAVLERQLLNSIVPAGIVSYFGGAVADIPPRFILCDGSFFDPKTYPELFDKIRYTYGRDTDNCFAVPDLRASIIQGVSIESGCFDESEKPLWEGRDPSAGAIVEDNVVGSKIKHLNTEHFKSPNNPQVGDKTYAKMALVPIISTGELCGRYEIKSTSTTPNNGGTAGNGTITFNETTNEFCLLDDQGVVVSCVSLSSISGGDAGTVIENLQDIEYITPTTVYEDLNTTTFKVVDWTSFDLSPHIPTDATHVILEGWGSVRNPDQGTGLTNTSFLQIRADGASDAYDLVGVRASGNGDGTATTNQGIFPINNQSLEFATGKKGASNSVFDDGVSVKLIGYVKRTISTVVDPNADKGKQVYYDDDGIIGWTITAGDTNINTNTDLNTLTGVTVPTWATHVILHGLFDSTGTAVCNVKMGGRTLSELSSTTGQTQHAGEFTIPLTGNSLTVNITSSGGSNGKISILGFKNLF